MKSCNSGQCIHQARFCNNLAECDDLSDEGDCPNIKVVQTDCELPCRVDFVSHLDLVHDQDFNPYNLQPLSHADQCPDSHFLCADDLCLPVFLRCNGVKDYLKGEDELDCQDYTCVGYYKCRASSVCLHQAHLCDGQYQCPQNDDEQLCDLTCPTGCKCQGLAFVCPSAFSPMDHTNIRYLDMSYSHAPLANLYNNRLLIRLHAIECKINTIHDLPILPNLRYFDLSKNFLTVVNMDSFYERTKNIDTLILAYNPIKDIISSHDKTMTKLHHLDISNTELTDYDYKMLLCCPNLQIIQAKASRIKKISDGGFRSTKNLEMLDLEETDIQEFPDNVLKDLHSLTDIISANFKLCCPALLPAHFTDMTRCIYQQDLLASCDDLLRSDGYRGFLWAFAVMTITGNTVSFVSRLWLNRKKMNSFAVFVTNLTLADLLMGIYLAIIGAADIYYQGKLDIFSKISYKTVRLDFYIFIFFML